MTPTKKGKQPNSSEGLAQEEEMTEGLRHFQKKEGGEVKKKKNGGNVFHVSSVKGKEKWSWFWQKKKGLMKWHVFGKCTAHEGSINNK